METPPVHPMNLTNVLSESKRIIISNYTHFITLSLLFFLPLAFSLIISPTAVFSGQLFTTDHFHNFSFLAFFLLYIVTVYTLALCAIATITYSTYRAYSGEPLNFFITLKTLTTTFIPIVSTAIVANVLLFLISLTFLVLVVIILALLQTLGFVIEYNSIYFISLIGTILIVILIYIYVNWSLAFAVVVVESKWGFAPLMRSSYLVKGMRSDSLFTFLYFGICGVLMVWLCWFNVGDQFSIWVFLPILMFASFFMMMFLLRIIAANTVLYIYCMAFHGESVINKVNERFDHKYVNLPSDDVKVPQAVMFM